MQKETAFECCKSIAIEQFRSHFQSYHAFTDFRVGTFSTNESIGRYLIDCSQILLRSNTKKWFFEYGKY